MIGEAKDDEISPLKTVDRSLINSLDLELNRERLSLHNEVVKWCSEQIKRTMQKNPIAPEDPAQYFKDKLCDAQLQVLERSKEIASLQSRLTELVIQSPEAAVALQDLKEVIESVQLKRNTNGFGYGQEVVNIACSTVDSVKVLVDQVKIPEIIESTEIPETPEKDTESDDQVEEKMQPRTCRSQSENIITFPKKDGHDRRRSYTTTPATPKTPVTPVGSRDISALSNL